MSANWAFDFQGKDLNTAVLGDTISTFCAADYFLWRVIGLYEIPSD